MIRLPPPIHFAGHKRRVTSEIAAVSVSAAVVCALLLTQATPLRAQIATGASSGGGAASGGGATGGVTAPAVGGTGQASSAPSVGSISSPSSSGASSASTGAPSANGNSNGSGSASYGNGNGNSAASGGSNANNGGNSSGPQSTAGNPLSGKGPITLTLSEIVNIVLGNNTAVIEARQRLQLAVEQINQLNAQAKPQLRADAADSYNSYRATTTTLGPTVQNPVLPSGGTIPTITDQAAADISSLSSATSVSGTVAPGVSSSASFGPAGPGGGVGGGGSATGTGASSTSSGGVGAGSSTTSSTPETATSSGGNSSGTAGAPTTSGTSTSGAAGTAGTGAGNANGNGAPASNGASGSSNGTAGEGTTGAGNTGTSGTNNSAAGSSTSGSSTNGANSSGTAGSAGSTSGSAGNASGAAAGAGQAGQSSSTAGTTGGANSSGTTGTGTNGVGGSSTETTPGVSSSTGTGTDGAATSSSSSSLIAPQEQLAAMPSILQAYLTADSGGSDEADEIADATQTHARITSASIVRPSVVAARATPEMQQPSAGGTGTGTGTGTGDAADAISSVEGQRNTYAARATGSQYIDLFGYFPASRDVQNSIRDFYLLDLERIENETALAAKNTFFNVLYAQAEYAVEQEQASYAAENVRITTDRRQQGVAADYDVLTAETALANAQQLLITAQNQLELANSQFSYLVGVDPDRQVTLVAPASPPVTETFNLPQSEQTAIQRRPELRQAQKNVDIANRLIKLAGATLSPTLGIVGVAQYNSTDTTFTPHSLATISAQLGIPIDDGGATRSRVRSARIDLQTQQINLGSLQSSVSLEVRQAILSVNNAQTRVSTSGVAVSQAEEARRLAVVRYENGLGTLLDITNAVAQLATAQSNLADANFSYQTALATLVRNEGGR